MALPGAAEAAARFAKIPNDILYSELNPVSRLVYAVIANDCRLNGYCDQTIRQMARRLHLGRNTVWRGVQELIAWELITFRQASIWKTVTMEGVRTRCPGRRNIYRLPGC